MLLKSFKGFVGNLSSYTNTYLIFDEKTFDGALIDIANNLDEINEYVESKRINLKYIILTHCHADHIAGLKDIKKYYPNIKILIHELDAPNLVNDEVNLSKYIEAESNFVTADITLKDGDELEVGNLKLKIIHTPGHTIGSICVLVEDALFSGDTLFKGSYGRTDFPTGSTFKMINSIKELLKLPDNTIVYPGHNASTIIGEEK